MADLFELDTGIDYSKFASLKAELESLKGRVSGWVMANEDPNIDKDPYSCCGEEADGWTHEMNSEKQTVVADLATCVERIDNITKAIECVIHNHRGLQESYKYSGPSVRRYREDGSLYLKSIDSTPTEANGTIETVVKKNEETME